MGLKDEKQFLIEMSSERFGDVARKFYNKWNTHQLGILQHQENNLIQNLHLLKGEIIQELLEDALQGAKFRRFFYSDLNSMNKYHKPICHYEVNLMLKDERFDIVYEKTSFVVKWEDELK